MTAQDYYDHRNQPVRLGQELGRGGEGAVFAIAGAASVVAKIYHQPPRAEVVAKLRAMAALARLDLCQTAAWPEALLFRSPGGQVAGLLMRKVQGFKEAHTLYSPAHRKMTFPQADWGFLLHTARNCAAAFANLHQAGIVVGDVNQSNVLVSQRAEVFLIDCDSYQVQSGGQIFTCDVGVPLFTPPELQGKTLRGTVRTANHDQFGLAVLLFHLLFMGRHPFSGRYLGVGDMPIDRAITELRFAYGRPALSLQMQPPLHSLSLSAVPDQVSHLFERAFGRHTSSTRPTAVEWVGALDGLMKGLKTCGAHTGHRYAAHLASCPWCELMRQGAPNFFITVVAVTTLPGTGQPFILTVVWARIDQVRPPSTRYQRPAFPHPSRPPFPLPPGVSKSLPPEPPKPAILVTTPISPPSRIARPARQKVRVSSTQAQRVGGWFAGGMGAGALFFFVIVVMFVLHSAARSAMVRGNAAVTGFLAMGGGCFLAAAVSGTFWLLLELKRREQERALNQEYEDEQRRWREAVREEKARWERAIAAERKDARQKYAALVARREAVVQGLRTEADKRRQARQQAETRVGAAERQWQTAASRIAGDFASRKEVLRRLKDQHEQLNRNHAAKWQELQRKVKDMQFQQHLQNHFISDHKINGIGPTREAALASFGIETAWDVELTAILEVPGIGDKLGGNLLAWRAQIEQTFRFDPKVGVPEHERRALEANYLASRQPVEQQLALGAAQLEKITTEGEAELRRLHEQIRASLQQLAEADLNLTVLPRGV